MVTNLNGCEIIRWPGFNAESCPSNCGNGCNSCRRGRWLSDWKRQRARHYRNFYDECYINHDDGHHRFRYLQLSFSKRDLLRGRALYSLFRKWGSICLQLCGGSCNFAGVHPEGGQHLDTFRGLRHRHPISIHQCDLASMVQLCVQCVCLFLRELCFLPLYEFHGFYPRRIGTASPVTWFGGRLPISLTCDVKHYVEPQKNSQGRCHRSYMELLSQCKGGSTRFEPSVRWSRTLQSSCQTRTSD